MATVSIAYLLPNGGTLTHGHDIAPQSRRTFTIDDQAPELANVPVSMIVTSTNTQPIVLERAMYTRANGITWTAGTAVVATKLQ